MDKIRQIIREEVYRIMQEIGEDPIQLSQDMVKSNEEQVKELELELKFRENDTRVNGLSPEEKKARIAVANVTKQRLEIAKSELEMTKQAQINAVKMQQQSQSSETEPQAENPLQGQIQTQI